MSGIIGLIFTFIYVIIGGILYVQYYPSTEIYKIDSDGSVAENEGSKGFKCYYFSSKGDRTSLYAKYIDYMKSQYNYNKELSEFYKDNEKCVYGRNNYAEKCSESEYITVNEDYANCRKLYINNKINSSDMTESYDMSAKFFTVIFFSILMIPCYIALIFFSFGLPKSSSDYTTMGN